MELRYFIIRRTLLLVPTIIGVTILEFIFLRAFPDTVLLENFINKLSATSGGNSSSVLIAHAKIVLGLNYPVPVQYFYFLINLFTGNWGFTTSPTFDSVYSIIGLMWPNTAQLMIFTIILSTAIGIPLGSRMGSKPNSGTDNLGRVFALVGYAMPQFFFGLLLILVFGKGILHWPGAIFPFYSMVTVPIPPPAWLFDKNLGFIVSSPTHMIFFDALINHDPRIAWSAFMHMVLPVLTLTYAVLAIVVRTMRSGVIDASVQEYIRTARAKGVPVKMLFKNHVRRNAVLPTITIVGVMISYLLTGVIVVETLFNYHGLGWYVAQSVLSDQIYGIIYSSFLFGIFLIVATLVADVLYAYIDPRIRY